MHLAHSVQYMIVLCHIVNWVLEYMYQHISPVQPLHTIHCLSGCWTASDIANQDTPSPEGHGWTMDKNWVPMWTIPIALKTCSKIVKYECKKGCEARCACKKAN